MTIHIYVILSSLLGFSLSTYVFKKTKRESLEHKAMFFIDLLFVAAFIYGAVSLLLGVDVVFPEWLILAILVPLNSYVGVVAVHHRNESIEIIARESRRKEEEQCHKLSKAQ